MTSPSAAKSGWASGCSVEDGRNLTEVVGASPCNHAASLQWA